MTSGKTVFIEFLAPWGGHCKSMKPAWDSLMEEFADSKTALVADVDCTVEEALCSTHGVQGYPTIKHGSPDAMEDYNGGRTLEDMQTFARESLGPSCGPDNLELCSDEQKAEITTVMARSLLATRPLLMLRNSSLLKLRSFKRPTSRSQRPRKPPSRLPRLLSGSSSRLPRLPNKRASARMTLSPARWLVRNGVC